MNKEKLNAETRLVLDEIGILLRRSMAERQIGVFDLARATCIAPELIFDICDGRAHDIELRVLVDLFVTLGKWPSFVMVYMGASSPQKT